MLEIKIPRTIKEEDVIITKDTQEDKYPIEVTCGAQLLADCFQDYEYAKSQKESIVNYYNNDLWNDSIFLHLMIRYKHHINKFNNEGWKRRGDFPTPETYAAFITGIETTIRGYIFETFNNKFAGNYCKTDKEAIKEYIYKED